MPEFASHVKRMVRSALSYSRTCRRNSSSTSAGIDSRGPVTVPPSFSNLARSFAMRASWLGSSSLMDVTFEPLPYALIHHEYSWPFQISISTLLHIDESDWLQLLAPFETVL